MCDTVTGPATEEQISTTTCTTVNGDLMIGDSLTLSYDVTVNGSVKQNGSLNPNGHTLTISDDLNISGYLTMDNINNKIIVGDDVVIFVDSAMGFFPSAGTLEIKGDFNQTGGGMRYEFQPSGTFTTLFSGTGGQSISFESDTDDSYFSNLTITNTSSSGVQLQSDVNVTTTYTSTAIKQEDNDHSFWVAGVLTPFDKTPTTTTPTTSGGGGGGTTESTSTNVSDTVSSLTGGEVTTSSEVSVPTDSSVSFDSEAGTVSAEFELGDGESAVSITTPTLHAGMDPDNENTFTLTTITPTTPTGGETSLLTPEGTTIRPLGDGLQFSITVGEAQAAESGIQSVNGKIESDGTITVTTESTSQDEAGNTITTIQEVQINPGSNISVGANGEISATTTMGSSLGTVTTQTIVSSGGRTSVTFTSRTLGKTFRSTPAPGSENIKMKYIDYSYYNTKTKTIDLEAKARIEKRALSGVDFNALQTQFTSNRNFTVYEREETASGGSVISSVSSSSTSSINTLEYLMEKDLKDIASIEIIPHGNSDEKFEDTVRFDGVRTIRLTAGWANIMIDGVEWRMMPGLTYEVLPETTEEVVEEEREIGNDNLTGDELFIDGVFYLKEGWNLMTAPTDEELTITGVVNSISWKYDHESGWEKDSTTLEPGYGYWIQLQAEQELDLGGSGATYKPIYSDLESGWHLLGTGEKLSLIHNAETVDETWVYDKESVWSRNPQTIHAGQGFWVKRK